MNYTALGKRIRYRRKALQMTQAQAAKSVGISLSFYGHIERGTRKASIETLVSIANGLKANTDWLLEDSLDATMPRESMLGLVSRLERDVSMIKHMIAQMEDEKVQ